LKADEATHIEEIAEALETDLSSSEIFAARFEQELAGKAKSMPGKNFAKSLKQFVLCASLGRCSVGGGKMRTYKHHQV
jgi:hypothetical protein